MAVHTCLLDFTIEPKSCETIEGRKLIKENVENCLKEYINDLRCESFIELDGGFLAVFVGARGTFITVRGVKQGIVTVNVEYYKGDSEEDMLSFERVRSLDSLFHSRLDVKKSHKYPSIKRGGTERYFLSSDERLLEYDIDKIVFEETSPYQKIQILHSKSLGNILALDDLQNMSESDLIYTETLMQRGVENYEDKEIIILGGGDGCLLWELLKEKPKFVTMLELDEMVIKACSTYLRSSCGNCLDRYKGEKYEIIVGDCFETLDKFISEGKKVDYVFGDLTDVPVDSNKQHLEIWEFIRLILNKSMQVLRPGGKYLTHGNGVSAVKSLQLFENVLRNLKVPVNFTKTDAFIPSFLEKWIFYQITPCLMFVNDESNIIAEKSLDVMMNFIRRNPKIGVQVEGLTRVSINGSDAKAILDILCREYGDAVRSGRMPHVVLDATLAGVTSETVKSFTSALAIPTVSMSYGQESDIRAWRNLDKEDEKYLVQVMPPGDLIPQVVRSIVLAQNISNAAILFDDSFVMDHKYKSLLQNIPTRHVISAVEDSRSIKKQLTKMRDLDVVNFFILGRLTTIKMVLDNANINKYFGKKFAWHAITQDRGGIKCSCSNATVLFLKPEPDPDSRDRLGKLKSTYSMTAEPEITAAFYFDVIFRTLIALKTMLDEGEWPKEMEYVLCEDFSENKMPKRNNLDLRRALMDHKEPPFYAPMVIESNGHSYMKFNMKIEKATIINSQTVSAEDMGDWKASLNGPIKIKDPQSMSNFTAVTVYKVVTVIQHPFIFVDPNSKDSSNPYSGYCIDLLEEIRKLIKFDYVIYEAPDKKFGNMDDKGQWNGMIKELIDKRADIGLGSLSVMAERENVIDFTVPYYDLVGITILMKKSKTPTSLFKFLTVLENDVWLCILAAYFFTSFLMWVFDRWSPYSYQNNREKYKDDEEKREFNLKECLWFCMTSLTPQGGGEAPKNLSGRLVAATWWLFGFIIIASYTANLAAFLTVSRLDTPVESLDDLSKQYKIQYAPVNGSTTMTYFERMADIETKFYEIWKDMSLNDSLSEVERAKLAVWDYPVSDKYTKMWQAMKEARLPQTLDEALERVRNSTSSSEGFAYLGDATDIKYQYLTNCDFQIVGEEFSRKPYAIAVQQGSPLKDQFNNAILQLLNKRKLEKLKEKWWTNNPNKAACEKQDEQNDGISIQNIGGVFIVIFVGIGMACITLAFEYWWYKYKRNPRIVNAVGEGVKPAFAAGKGFGQNFGDFQNRNTFRGRPSRHNNAASLPGVENF